MFNKLLQFREIDITEFRKRLQRKRDGSLLVIIMKYWSSFHSDYHEALNYIRHHNNWGNFNYNHKTCYNYNLLENYDGAGTLRLEENSRSNM